MILVLNCGSSSLKFCLFDGSETLCARGAVDRLGQSESTLVFERDGEKTVRSLLVADHAQALSVVVDALRGLALEVGALEGIGHRVVHGGEHVVEAVQITPDIERGIEACAPLAPLHNSAALEGVRAARRLFAGVPQVGVFDTAFHQTLPPRAFLYAVPRALHTEQGIRRYGFHGTSHRYLAMRAGQMLEVEPEKLHVITCHLGNGVSLAAVAGGRCVDTTMGLTPLEGIPMGTRSGDIDPALVFHLVRGGRTLDEVEHMLQYESGLLGLSGQSQDVRELETAAKAGDEAAAEALEVFAYRVRKAVGSYCAVLGRVDALVFSGGIGQHSAFMRRRVLEGLRPMGLHIDSARNRNHAGDEGTISHVDSRIKILVVPTNEELVIAREVREVLDNAENV